MTRSVRQLTSLSKHADQADVQIGNGRQLYCPEYGIQLDGQMSSDNIIRVWHDVFSTLFSETGAGKNVPLPVFVELQLTMVDEILAVTYR